jgi:hypothetical protein
MKRLFLITSLLILTAAVNAGAQAGSCDCYGGLDTSGVYWQLLDYHGVPLENGDWAYAAWTGPDGQIDPPGADGYPGDDDMLLPISADEIEYSTFFMVVATWPEGAVDYDGVPRHPAAGDLIYCRIFDAPWDSVGPGTYYGDSQTHRVVWKLGDEFYCLFPGDPGHGQTDTPVPPEPAAADSSQDASAEEEPCGKQEL